MTDSTPTPSTDRTACAFCGETFVPGDLARDHARGRRVCEECYQDVRSTRGDKGSEHYASEPHVVTS